MFLLFVFFPILEIYVLIEIGGLIGFWNTVFVLLASAVLGAGIVRNQGRFLLNNMQSSLAQGQVPSKDATHGLMIFFGGLFLIFPGFLSKIIGALLILPGSRHLAARFFKKSIERKLRSGAINAQGFGGPGGSGFRVFTFGSQGFRSQGFESQKPPPRSPRLDNDSDQSLAGERDVTPKVIDVTPISSETHEKKR